MLDKLHINKRAPTSAIVIIPDTAIAGIVGDVAHCGDNVDLYFKDTVCFIDAFKALAAISNSLIVTSLTSDDEMVILAVGAHDTDAIMRLTAIEVQRGLSKRTLVEYKGSSVFQISRLFATDLLGNVTQTREVTFVEFIQLYERKRKNTARINCQYTERSL